MKKNNLYFGLVLGVFALGFIGYMAIAVVPKVFVTWTKAAPAKKVSLSNSYLIGGKILAKADGTDKCDVNVFVLDSSGKGVSGIPVTLSGMDSGEVQAASEIDGKASFGLTSVTEGQFTLSASIGGVPLDKTLKVTFRN